MPDNEWLCSKQAAEYLASVGCFVSHRTLANLRSNNNRGAGPSFTRTRWRTVRYRKTDLDAWANRETVRIE
jgi:hypothetical protein